ncbi:peptidoglycan recognition protein family protein [Streptomyces lanatus]|uniref:Peptidoglycan recognition protein n=1 Tax=Streptomyces lanatus TaxID=66900 RepID=A0ABV1XRU4_9ACTN|nr:peptidoglycan recognition protein [Streptomyces lanatus]
MRGFLASSIGVTCAVALALPLTPPAVAASARPSLGAETAASRGTVAGSAVRRADVESYLPGSTQSLPLAPLDRERAAGAPAEQGLPRRDVNHFSLVGVVWDDPQTELHGRVQVRTRAVGSGTWSGWRDVETHNAEHAADPDTAEAAQAADDGVRGATAPLWVGESDGVEVRVTAEAAEHAEPQPEEGLYGGDDSKVIPSAITPLSASQELPEGLHLELVDPGDPAPVRGEPGAARPGSLNPGTSGTSGTGGNTMSADALAASAANAQLAPLGAAQIPALDRADTERELLALRGSELTAEQRAKPYIGPRPRIVTRRGWGADESWRERQFAYTQKVKAAFVHHTASGNYWCTQAPSLIRGIYRYHVMSMRWRDIGYNFLVDKCGNIYEGRAGGVAKPVLGAHTLGFNSNSMGIAVLGSYGAKKPTAATLRAIARLTAWKLGLYGANPRGKTYLTSGGGSGNLYRKGKTVRLNVVSGHRDSFATECPGWQLYRRLGSARASAAHYQGR